MASAVLDDPTRALQGTNRGSGLSMEESENDVGSLEQHLLRSCRYSGVKGSARKGRLDLRFASASCQKIVCGTIASPTSTRIVERFTVGSTSACRTILRSSLLVVFLFAPDTVFCTDEAHFWLNGYVDKQNCRIWNEANPQVYVETPLHPEKPTVWCALWAGGIIGLYFFKNDEGHNVTVNNDRYRVMITNFFVPELNNHDVQELWFQQDGETCHTARGTIDLLKDTIGDRLISRFGPVN
ncbi:putative DD41D transposase [Trichonephila clavipes]|nr:putative DD41D transposase [Trichonephila clavipes]